jgi:SAM-dependent methyltransferase
VGQAYGAEFARIYNTQWSGFSRRMAPRIERFYHGLPRSVRKHRTLLDLCCGTGQLAAYFLRKGFDVTALDLSSPMLELAEENMRDIVTNSSATFVRADVARFQLDKPHGLVVATYNALNHLPDLDSLRSCFASVAAATVSDGCFIFDLYTKRGVREWNGISVTDTGGTFTIQRGIYDGGSRAQTLFTGFIRDGDGDKFTRFEESIFNTVFDLTDVEQLLAETGWASAYFAQSDDLAAPISEPELEDRVWIVARR